MKLRYIMLVQDGTYPPAQALASAKTPPTKPYSAPPTPKSPTPSIATPPVPHRAPVKKEGISFWYTKRKLKPNCNFTDEL